MPGAALSTGGIEPTVIESELGAVGSDVAACSAATGPPVKSTARTPTATARPTTTAMASRNALAAPRRTSMRAEVLLVAAARGASGVGFRTGAGTGSRFGRRSIVGGRSAQAPATLAPASSKGWQARHALATWFQQFEQHELEHSGQTLNSLAPAEPRRSRSSPHRSQNELVSYTRSPISSAARPEAARPDRTIVVVVGREHASGRTGRGPRTSRFGDTGHRPRAVDAGAGPRVRWSNVRAIDVAHDERGVDLDRHAARPTSAPTIVDAIRSGSLDAELAGLLWLLLDGGVPIVVAGPGGTEEARADRRAALESVLDLLPSTRSARPLDGAAEDFTWIASAETLGWRRTLPAATAPADPASTVILAGELGAGPPADTTGDRARLAVRAIGLGFGLAATAEAARLEDLVAMLTRRSIGLGEDELARLGVVLILGPRRSVDAVEPSATDSERTRVPAPKIVAAHYLRPLARDVHGHTQRLPPAVLATWDPRIARFEHFAWGIAGELAERLGRRTGDFEAERERRSAALAGLAAVDPDRADLPDRAAIRAALDRARIAEVPGGDRRH